MNPNESRNTRLILIGIGCAFVVWAAVIAAPFLSNGLIGIIRGLAAGMAHPFRVGVPPNP